MKQARHSTHSETRSHQRGISTGAIDVALQYGEKEHTHGSFAFVLTDRALRRSPLANQADRLRGLRVVVAPSGRIITVEWYVRVAKRPGPLRGICVRGAMNDSSRALVN